MITIPNYTSSLTPFTLLENTTYPYSATTYILQLFSKEVKKETLLFLTGDTSNNVNRYNYFPINLTPYNLPEGQYDYKVYQNTGTTLSLSALTINDVVESGLATIYGTAQTPRPVYSASGQTQYVFN
jgi:hypothetical protein